MTCISLKGEDDHVETIVISKRVKGRPDIRGILPSKHWGKGAEQRDDRYMPIKVGVTGAILVCQPHLRTEVVGQNGHGHCKSRKVRHTSFPAQRSSLSYCHWFLLACLAHGSHLASWHSLVWPMAMWRPTHDA